MSTVTSSAIDTARIDYNPDDGLLRGLLIEGQRINSLLDKRDLSGGAWTAINAPTITQDQPGIDRVANKAWTVTDDSATLSEYLTQSITVPDNSNMHVVSIYIKKTSATQYCGFRLTLTGGTPVGDGAGDVFLAPSNGAKATTDTDIDLHEVHDAGDYWRLIGGITNNTTGNVTLQVLIVPAGNTDGSANQDVATTGSMIYDWGQVELNAKFASSPIPDGVGAVTRAADNVTSTITGGMPAEWSVVFDGTTAPGTEPQRMFAYGNGTANNRLIINRVENNRNMSLVSVVGGSLTINNQVFSSDFPDLSAIKVALAVVGGNVRVSINGGAVQVFAGEVASSTFTARYVGRYEITNQWQWGGWIKNFTEYHRPLSDAELIAASTL